MARLARIAALVSPKPVHACPIGPWSRLRAYMINSIIRWEYPENGIYFCLREEKTTGVLSWMPSQHLTPPQYLINRVGLTGAPTGPLPLGLGRVLL